MSYRVTSNKNSHNTDMIGHLLFLIKVNILFCTDVCFRLVSTEFDYLSILFERIDLH